MNDRPLWRVFEFIRSTTFEMHVLRPSPHYTGYAQVDHSQCALIWIWREESTGKVEGIQGIQGIQGISDVQGLEKLQALTTSSHSSSGHR